MTGNSPKKRGRGAGRNPAGRFETIQYEADPEAIDPMAPSPQTEFLRDISRSIITYNESPDIPDCAGLNPYRGCEHGCIYCYARPFHEYLGFSAGLDFETKILVKEDAPELLRRELESLSWVPQTIGLSGVTDPYQPVEKKLGLTRRCLEVLAEFRNPVSIITKNHLITRDIDLLAELSRFDAAAAFVSVTTLDPDLARIMEPRTSQPEKRIAAIEALSKAGIPTGVMVAPVVPGLTDHEMPAILAAAAKAGSRFAFFIPVRLPGAVSGLFEQWLETHFPDKKEKVLNRIRSTHGGSLNDPRFGARMKGEGIFVDQMKKVFRLACRKAGIVGGSPELSTAAFRRPGPVQERLFE